MTQLAVSTPEGRVKELLNSLDRNVTQKAYGKGKNLSRYLESQDPSKDHKGHLANMDAYNRLLTVAGIRTKSVPSMGIEASVVEDMVEHRNAQHLVVEFFARQYRKVAHGDFNRNMVMSKEGAVNTAFNRPVYDGPRDLLLQPAIPITELVGQTTGINQTYYKPFYLEDVQNANSRVAEGAEIPAVKIAQSEKQINLVKYGRRIDTTYEAIRRLPIDVLGFYVQRIAVAVEADKVSKVLNVLVVGDGNAGTAATSYNLDDLNGAAAAGVFNLTAWLTFKMKWQNPLMMTTVLGQDAEILKLLLLDTGSANLPLYNLPNFPAATAMTPINQSLRDGIRYGWTSEAPANRLVAFDRRMAIERLFEIGGNVQESGNDIKQQINNLVLSEVEGYAVIDPKATKVIVMNA